jgi:phosphate-selective porin
VIRLTANPFYGWNENQDLHIGISARYSDFKNGGQLRQHPEAFFASKYIETGLVEGDYLFSQNYELAYRIRNLLITSEVTRMQLSNASLNDPSLHEAYIQADYLITGETHPYTPRNGIFSPAVPKKSVQHGGGEHWNSRFDILT